MFRAKAEVDISESSGTLSEEVRKYGELIVLGATSVDDDPNWNFKRHRPKLELFKHKVGNGIKKGFSSSTNIPPRETKAVMDPSRHVVSFVYRSHTIIVEYITDETKDMFQIGRSTESQIDFTVVDSWLGARDKIFISPEDSNVYVNSLLHANIDNDGHVVSDVPISSTISRYACRILVEREKPHRAFVYAAGFDASKNIFLGQKACKWTKENGDVDALTTNGIWVLHPNQSLDESSDNSTVTSNSYRWCEVSVNGDIYDVRPMRSSSVCGKFLPNETNELRDGTLIDLCGATLLWRTSQGLAKSPSFSELESRLNELNAGKPQCPVNFNTLVVSKNKFIGERDSARQPYVYISCGHVQGKHDWGVEKSGSNTVTYKCPVCLGVSSRVVRLVMGTQPAFHLDSEALDHAFNPCGHVASLSTVRYWSRILIPYGAYNHSPLCPFCTNLLERKKPYLRLIFQDHVDD